jgi:hypothetical protein
MKTLVVCLFLLASCEKVVYTTDTLKIKSGCNYKSNKVNLVKMSDNRWYFLEDNKEDNFLIIRRTRRECD